MTKLPNIEKSAFRRGEYVGYACGMLWHIRRSTSSYRTWYAVCRDDDRMPFLYGSALRELSARLAGHEGRKA